MHVSIPKNSKRIKSNFNPDVMLFLEHASVADVAHWDLDSAASYALCPTRNVLTNHLCRLPACDPL